MIGNDVFSPWVKRLTDHFTDPSLASDSVSKVITLTFENPDIRAIKFSSETLAAEQADT